MIAAGKSLLLGTTVCLEKVCSLFDPWAEGWVMILSSPDRRIREQEARKFSFIVTGSEQFAAQAKCNKLIVLAVLYRFTCYQYQSCSNAEI